MTYNFSVSGILSGLDFGGIMDEETRALILKSKDPSSIRFDYFTELLVDGDNNRAL